MGFDLNNTWDSIKDGISETAEVAHVKTNEFHEKYVSKVTPDFGKYGDAAKFAAEMVPGVSEYNAIKDGDWQAFAIAAGIDIAAVAIGAFTAGAGYAAVKGGTSVAKAGVKVAVKEVAEAGAKKIVKETVEAGAKKVVKETVEAGAEKIVKETVEAGAEKIVKETVEAGVEKVAKETVEAGAEKVVKETVEARAEKVVKETAEAGAEKATKEVTEAGTEKALKETAETGSEKTILEVGDKIDKTRFSEYVDEIEKITKREIPQQQKELIETALKEKDFTKLSKEATELARKEFKNNKSSLIQTWEKMTGNEWPKYADDILNETGDVIRTAGQPYDAHHIIELSTSGPNEWWNLHPASFPGEHQNGIHAAGSLAKLIFG